MEKLEKKYYKISEVAEMIGLPASTLRFWESRFTIISPRRNSRGTRFYTPSDVDKLRMVAYLVKEKGLRLEAAQEHIPQGPGHRTASSDSRSAPGAAGFPSFPALTRRFLLCSLRDLPSPAGLKTRRCAKIWNFDRPPFIKLCQSYVSVS